MGVNTSKLLAFKLPYKYCIKIKYLNRYIFSIFFSITFFEKGDKIEKGANWYNWGVPVVPVPEVKKDEKPIVVDTKQQAQHGVAAKALADAAGKYFQNYVFINIKIKYLYIYFFCLFLFFIYRKSGRRA